MTPPVRQRAAVVDDDDEVLTQAAAAADQAGSVPEETIDLARLLAQSVRAHNAQDLIDHITTELRWQDLRALAVVLAALVPPDVDVKRALEWVELQPYGWSDQTVAAEAGRWARGARDFTAARARHEQERRQVRAGSVR